MPTFVTSGSFGMKQNTEFLRGRAVVCVILIRRRRGRQGRQDCLYILVSLLKQTQNSRSPLHLSVYIDWHDFSFIVY